MGIAIHKRLIAAVAMAAVLVTGIGVSQAKADNFGAEQALAALLGLAVIGAIISENRDDDRKADRITRRAPATIQPRALPHRASKRALPGRCLRTLNTNRGQSRVFGARCLQNNYRFVNRLPRSCERRVRTDRGPRLVWSARCLRRNGFQIAGR